GINVGLLSARVLVATIASGAPLHRYARQRQRILLVPRVLTRLLLVAAHRPALRHGFARVVAACPALFDRLVALDAGEGFRGRRAPGGSSLRAASDRGAR